MANPRQRRKARSSTHKAISHSKRAKRLQKKMPSIRGPKALQDAWDSSKTLRQKCVTALDRATQGEWQKNQVTFPHYLALGLQHDLNPVSSGGLEDELTRTANQNHTSQPLPTVSSPTVDGARSPGPESSTAVSTLPKGFGRIIRDSLGNVIRVELSSRNEAGDGSKRELVIDPPVVTTESELRIWAHCAEASRGGAIVQDLESLAAPATVRERYTSLGERSYLERLVKKYGDDLDGMARDRRVNPEQRTAKELGRAIAKAGRGDTGTKVAG